MSTNGNELFLLLFVIFLVYRVPYSKNEMKRKKYSGAGIRSTGHPDRM